jgi:hypothetical protein
VSFELSVIAGHQTTASAWLMIASGISGIFYGATAKQFRRFGGFSGREREDFTPERRHLCLARIKSAFEMNNIQRGHVTCYMEDISNHRRGDKRWACAKGERSQTESETAAAQRHKIRRPSDLV